MVGAETGHGHSAFVQMPLKVLEHRSMLNHRPGREGAAVSTNGFVRLPFTERSGRRGKPKRPFSHCVSYEALKMLGDSLGGQR